MPDREEVIKGLEHELRNRGKCGHYCREGIETFLCEYDKDGFCIQHWGKDAIALLKAQEPRVLTLDEYSAIAELPRSMREPVWIEWRDGGYGWAIPQRDYEVYGVDWRAWTDRPTNEMREATAWA